MTVQGWLAQASQQLLVPEQRTLVMRGNPRAMPWSWRLSFLPTISLEQNLLHQTGFFPPLLFLSAVARFLIAFQIYFYRYTYLDHSLL